MRKIFALFLTLTLAVMITRVPVSAVQIDTSQRTCLTKKYGAKVAKAIAASKKLTINQAKQLAACKMAATTPGSSGSSGTDGASNSTLPTLSHALLWSIGSQQAGLGNVSDPALLQLADGSIRMFFKNGNEPQIPIAGFDNKIHSYLSRDNGVTWTLESGVRLDVGSPVTVRAAESGGYEAWGWVPAGGGVDALTRFSSSSGADFTKGAGTAVSTSGCKNSDGVAAGFLGDAQVVKVASGYLAFAHDLAAGKSAPFKRQACKLTSTDGTTWSVDAAGTFAFDYDIQTNPELYRNAAGQLELWFHVDNGNLKYLEMRTSSNDGGSWSAATKIPVPGADPERLDLANGDSLLAFGNFDHTKGGLLAVSKKTTSSFGASRDEKVDSVTWQVTGAKTSDVKVKNLCTNADLTSSAKITASGSSLTVSYQSAGGPGSVGCVYLLLGAAQMIA